MKKELPEEDENTGQRLANRRHVYRPPHASRALNVIGALVGGLLFAFLLFYVIPLLKKLEGGKETVAKSLELAEIQDEPDEFEPEEDTPPDEVEEEEPEPLELDQEPMDIADLPIDLGSGISGKVLIDLKPNFDVAQDPNDMGGNDLDTPPRPVTKMPPRYPPALLKKKISGRAVVAMTVDENGAVTNAVIKDGSGFNEMDQEALKAAKRWKFKPGIKGGRKAVMTVVQPFNFKMNN